MGYSKSLIKKLVGKILDRFGFEVVYKYMWSPFYKDNERMGLYYEGLKKAQVEWTDNSHKRCRFYSLQQMVELVVKKGMHGDFAECGCWKGHSTFIISTLLAKNGFDKQRTVSRRMRHLA